jgi:hypothetical protein
LPVPPLPVTTCRRAGQRPARSFVDTIREYGPPAFPLPGGEAA